MARGQDTGNHPNRQVGREIHDRSIVDIKGTPTRREYTSRYDDAGNFVSQGYEHHGPASPNEVRAGTWRKK